MLDTLMIVHAAIWFTVGAVLLIGNLTYADYYTKLNAEKMKAFWVVYSVVSGMGIINYVLSFVIDSLVLNKTPDGFALTYGLGWLTVCAGIAYVVFGLIGTVVGFTKLKEYFGRKRNKI